jgi:hypothetical protein
MRIAELNIIRSQSVVNDKNGFLFFSSVFRLWFVSSQGLVSVDHFEDLPTDPPLT